ncbi:DUF3293 domain-containing protein [Myxococcota bacterium]|nr:DUF3293 domain-containing protein [Myxococcota bacterium]
MSAQVARPIQVIADCAIAYAREARLTSLPELRLEQVSTERRTSLWVSIADEFEVLSHAPEGRTIAAAHQRCDRRADGADRHGDGCLAGRSPSSWAYVTAANPGSERADAEVNEDRHCALLEHLRGRSLEWFEGAGAADDGAWPPEVSVLVLGIGREDAHALGRAFEQNAIVFGVVGGEPELLWCTP